jgi:hypothetical protein
MTACPVATEKTTIATAMTLVTAGMYPAKEGTLQNHRRPQHNKWATAAVTAGTQAFRGILATTWMLATAGTPVNSRDSRRRQGCASTGDDTNIATVMMQSKTGMSPINGRTKIKAQMSTAQQLLSPFSAAFGVAYS